MEAPDEDLEAVRCLSPSKKLAVMKALIRQAYQVKAAAIRARWPHLDEQEVQARTRALIAGERP